MNRKLYFFVGLIILEITQIFSAFAQVEDLCSLLQTDLRKEAECGEYSATMVSGTELSGDFALNLAEASDYINLTFQISTPGYYSVMVGGVAKYGAGKVVNVTVNGTTSSVAIAETGDISAGSFDLPAGDVLVKITPNWTWGVVDYVELVPDQSVSQEFSLNGPVTAGATEEAVKIYSFLKENFGKKSVSGAMLGDMDHYTAGASVKTHEDVEIYYTTASKYPALVGVDFMNATGKSADTGNSYYTTYTEKSLDAMRSLWALGGIPKFTWHWRDPSRATDQFYARNNSDHSDGTTMNFTSVMNEDGSWNTSSELYQNMIKDIDVIADYFLQLQKEGIAGIFRPLHEASGGWFWWGTQGGANYVKLYRLIYDEMVNVKGVKNLLWVWNPNSSTDEEWNPGKEYYDIISVDIYTYENGGPKYHVYDSQSADFLKLKSLSNSEKLIALTECGSIPDVELCYSSTVPTAWSWWMPWYESWNGHWVTYGTESSVLKRVMNDERIITLDDMPGWDNYNVSIKKISAQSSLIYPTRIRDGFYITQPASSVVVRSIDGRSVYETDHAGVQYVNSEKWPKGTYLVAIDGMTVKVIKL